ncbi:MAG: protein phosphatase [Rubricella sp.]
MNDLPLFLLDAPGGGRVGLAPMPGRFAGLEEDVRTLADAGTTLLLSMTTALELTPGLAETCTGHGIAWRHLPISDWGTPPIDVREAWPEASADAHARLDAGQTVIAHCAGGRGRSGMAVMRLMVERGADPTETFLAIRAIRPGAVETHEQRQWAAEGGAR